MPLTVGTAGHVDHGKTWLVRALTGKDTDRLPEEQRRGISIELGYAPLELPGGLSASLIDVPGHERFVRTMVAGATGIDLFLLVVDAGEGARPQTREHLAILRLLGVTEGIVAVTKADAVDADALELAVAEARELVPEAETVAVSAKTGEGLGELREALARVARRVERPRREGPTRLFVDRVFTLRGIGTVVTGTLWSGSIGAGDELAVEPSGATVRVRSVEIHDRPVERAEAGQRVAVALTGVDRTRLSRGLALVEPGAYAVGYRLDVTLDELAPLADGARVQAHHGTTETTARVVRRDGRPVQLRLVDPVVAAAGDRVVLRTGTTVAGAVVLDPAPVRTTAPEPEPAVARPQAPALSPESLEAVELALEAADGELFRAPDRRAAAALEREGRLVRLGDGFALERAAYERARELVVSECERADTITLARFRDLLGASRRTTQLLLERLDADGVTLRVGDERRLRRRRTG
jgi:selenocysteine-specific elongation factor